MAASRNSKPARRFSLTPFLVAIALAACSAGALALCHRNGWILYYGDAEAHLNIARRIVDSRTPGFDQLGTVWLPLPHLLMLPLVRDDWYWRTGLAGALPSALCFVIGGMFLYAAMRRIFSSDIPAVAGTAVYALNPNLLYLQSTPMTEPLFLACVLALLYFTVRFGSTKGWGALAGAAAAACAGSLVRYEGWFLIPFATVFMALSAGRRRVPKTAVFAAAAAAGAAAWLAHNWWYFGDALYFYTSPYSAQGIQGAAPYPGSHDWGKALLYFTTAARLCAGAPLFWLGLAGVAAALWRRAFWPVVLLLLAPVFYVLSLHSAGTPIFVPVLWPNSYYNTRYGLALLPLLALGAAALAAAVPPRARAMAAAGLLVAAMLPWVVRPRPDAWITWKESQVNSEGRRAWTRAAAEYLDRHYRRGSGIFTCFGDLTGIYRSLGLPLKETLTDDNAPLGYAAAHRPDLFLWEDWAVAMGGDTAQSGINRAQRQGPKFRLLKTIVVKNAPVIEIYQRSDFPAEAPHTEGQTDEMQLESGNDPGARGRAGAGRRGAAEAPHDARRRDGR